MKRAGDQGEIDSARGPKGSSNRQSELRIGRSRRPGGEG